MEDHRPIQQPPSASRIDVTVNVVVSGTIVLELRSTSDEAKLAALTASLKAPTAALDKAVSDNPIPSP